MRRWAGHLVERELAATVREALHGPAPRGLAGGASRLAERARRRDRKVAAVAVAVAVSAVLVTTALARGEDAAAAAGPLLDAGSMLSTDTVVAHVPGASVRAPAADVSPIGQTSGPGTKALFGGWCGDFPLVGAEEPGQAWAQDWVQQGIGGPGPAGAVRELVLRWGGADGGAADRAGASRAAAYVRASRDTPTRCGDLRGAPYPATTYTVRPPARSPAGGRAAPPFALGVASLTAAPPGAGSGDAAVGQDRTLPAWRVRAVRADGATVVDLTVVMRSASAAGAGAETLEMLAQALQDAGVDGPAR